MAMHQNRASTETGKPDSDLNDEEAISTTANCAIKMHIFIQSSQLGAKTVFLRNVVVIVMIIVG